MFPLLKLWTSENFFNGSGYGFNNRFGKINTLVPLNNISKSTDFKLFSLMSQIRFSFVKPPSSYDITGTREGIISRTGNRFKNIILFPGQSDYILRQNNTEVWPRNIQNINKHGWDAQQNKAYLNIINKLFASGPLFLLYYLSISEVDTNLEIKNYMIYLLLYSIVYHITQII